MIKPMTTGAAATPKDDRKIAAQQLESFFLKRLLAEARPESSDGGFAGDTFKEMLDQQLADKMSQSGGIGLAKMIVPALGHDKSSTAAAPNTAAFTADLPANVAHGLARIPSTKYALPSTTARAATTGQLPTTQLPTAELPTGPGGFIDGAQAPTLITPISGRRASGYGMRTDPINGTQSNHPGVDLAAPTGTPVAAAAAGKVTHAGPAGTYGNLVTVQHANGFETRYAHLSEVDVKVGDAVTPGVTVGKVGTTGRSTGPHLHFEVRHDGKVLDPTDLLPPLNRSTNRTNR